MWKGLWFLALFCVSSDGNVSHSYLSSPIEHIEHAFNKGNLHQILVDFKKDLASALEDGFGTPILKYDNSSDSSKIFRVILMSMIIGVFHR